MHDGACPDEVDKADGECGAGGDDELGADDVEGVGGVELVEQEGWCREEVREHLERELCVAAEEAGFACAEADCDDNGDCRESGENVRHVLTFACS